MDRLAANTMHRLHEFSDQGLKMLLWSFAKLDYSAPELYARASEELTRGRDVAAMKPVDVAVILWSYAKQGIQDWGVFQRVEDVYPPRIRGGECTPRDVAMMLWAYTELEFVAEDLMMAAAEWGADNLERFDNGLLVRLIWALAYNQGYVNIDRDIFVRIAQETLPRMNDFNPRQLGWMLAAFYQTGLLKPGKLMHQESLLAAEPPGSSNPNATDVREAGAALVPVSNAAATWDVG